MFVQDTRTECGSSLIAMQAQYRGELGSGNQRDRSSRPARVSWISTKRIEQAASWRSRGAWGYGCAQPQVPCARGAQRQRDSLAVALPPRLWCVAIDSRFCIASSYMLELYSIATSLTLSHDLHIVTLVIRRLGNYSGSSWACSW
jgi:hypothetical protein